MLASIATIPKPINPTTANFNKSLASFFKPQASKVADTRMFRTSLSRLKLSLRIASAAFFT
jgi:hypothetical protein